MRSLPPLRHSRAANRPCTHGRSGRGEGALRRPRSAPPRSRAGPGGFPRSGAAGADGRQRQRRQGGAGTMEAAADDCLSPAAQQQVRRGEARRRGRPRSLGGCRGPGPALLSNRRAPSLPRAGSPRRVPALPGFAAVSRGRAGSVCPGTARLAVRSVRALTAARQRRC